MKNETNILSLNNLSIGYKTAIFGDLNLSINKGEIVSIIGKNGIGKIVRNPCKNLFSNHLQFPIITRMTAAVIPAELFYTSCTPPRYSHY